MRNSNRRQFVVGTIGGAMALSVAPKLQADATSSQFTTRGVVLIPEDLSLADWPQRAKQAGLVLGPRPCQWMYGTTINFRHVFVPKMFFPNPIPINLRISEYDEDDLVIDWAREGVVTRIVRPTIDVSQQAEKMIEPVHFIADLVEACRRSRAE